MAKSSQALLIATLCFIGLLGFTDCEDDTQEFVVEGKVYCDTCRCRFPTPLSKPTAGAGVELQCRDRDNDTITATVQGVCDDNGVYQLKVPGEHQHDICEVWALNSTVPDCDERLPGRDRARIVLTQNNGIVSAKRFANSLGFLSKDILPQCPEVLKEMGLLPTISVSL